MHQITILDNVIELPLSNVDWIETYDKELIKVRDASNGMKKGGGSNTLKLYITTVVNFLDVVLGKANSTALLSAADRKDLLAVARVYGQVINEVSAIMSNIKTEAVELMSFKEGV